MKKYFPLFSTLICLALCLPCTAGVVGDFFPTADIAMGSGDGNNFNGGPSLLVRDQGSVDRAAMFKFDLSSIPSGVTVTSATLILTPTTASATNQPTVYKAWFSWDGSSTWNSVNVPTVTSTNYAGKTTGTNLGSDQFNVKSIVQDWVNGGTNNGFVVGYPNTASGNVSNYQSMETSSKPKLRVVYDSACAPANAVAGDCTNDGKVDFADFLILSANYPTASGMTWADGDFDCDGSISFTDFLILSANYGYPNGPQQAPTP